MTRPTDPAQPQPQPQPQPPIQRASMVATPWAGHPLFNAYIKAALAHQVETGVDHTVNGKALKAVRVRRNRAGAGIVAQTREGDRRRGIKNLGAGGVQREDLNVHSHGVHSRRPLP